MSDDPELALIFKIIWRLFVVTFGFCAAIVAAATVLATAIGHDLFDAIDMGNGPTIEHQAIRSFFLVLAFAGISFVPWAIGTVVAELLQFRSVFYHLGLGAVCGAAATILHPLPESESRVLQVAVATGLVAGGVYWLIAGRRAGDWWPRGLQRAYAAPPGPPAPPPL